MSVHLCVCCKKYAFSSNPPASLPHSLQPPFCIQIFGAYHTEIAPPACELLSSYRGVLYSQASHQVSEPSFCGIVKGLIHKEQDGAVISLDLECGVENLTAPE